MAERLAIVGGDAAGMSAASAARRREPTLDVVAFERGPYTSFSACGIPYFVGGLVEDSERLVTRSPDEHRARGIEVHTRTTVTAVDLARRELTVRDQSGAQRTEGFDQVVLATGAEAVPPDVPGAGATEPARARRSASTSSPRASGAPSPWTSSSCSTCPTPRPTRACYDPLLVAARAATKKL